MQIVSTRRLIPNQLAAKGSRDKHCIKDAEDLSKVQYKNIWAWQLEDAEEYSQPLPYDAKQGPVQFKDERTC